MTALAAPRLVPDPSAFGAGEVTVARVGDVAIERGDVLPDVRIAYRHDGQPPPAPQIVLVHALTGSADAAGDWWQPLIGPRRALDTDRYGVLCSNLLGGRYGSTGPTTIDPRKGRPYAAGFPDLTVRDQARAMWQLLDELGIERLALVAGGSLGGMVALEVALERPSEVDTVVPIAAPAATGAMAIAWDHVQLALVRRLGVEGMALARQIAMITYRSDDDLDGRFGRAQADDGAFAVASYLDHQAASSSTGSTPRRIASSRAPWTRTTWHAVGEASGPRCDASRREAPGSWASGSKGTSCTDRHRSATWSARRGPPA